MSGARSSIRYMRNEKQWWAPVWTGLVLDSQGRHYRQMKTALWLYLYFLLNADRRTGCLKRKIKTICADTGISSGTVARWLSVLKKGGYIAVQSTGRCLEIQIAKWRAAEYRNLTGQTSKDLEPRLLRNEISPEGFQPRNSPCLKDNSPEPSQANERTIKRYLLTKNIDQKKFLGSLSPALNRLTFKTREELLAWDLAQTLNDLPGFPLYLSCAKKFPESLLREILAQVQDVPPEKIKKSQGALFNYLIQKHGQQTTHHSGD
jgi:hypothetical protein